MIQYSSTKLFLRTSLLVILLFELSICYAENYYGTDTIKVMANDTIYFQLNDYTGQVQWQNAFDGIDFKDLTDQQSDVLNVRAENDIMYYRAKVTADGGDNCVWHSDTLVVITFENLPCLVNIAGVNSIQVEFNTTDSIVKDRLSKATQIIDSDTNTHTVSLLWKLINYKQDSAGQYEALGQFYLPSGVTQHADNPLDLQVATLVQVLEPAAPSVKTQIAIEIIDTSARLCGAITNTGGLPIIQKGFWWGKERNPEITGEKVIVNSNEVEYSFVLNNLNPNTIYYHKAFAINSVDTSLGLQYTFKTLPQYGNDSTFTVYYNNPNGWQKVYIRLWNSNGETFSDSTPGELMELPTNGNPWCSFKVPIAYTYMIFSSGIESEQTPNLERNVTGWYDGERWYDIQPEDIGSFTTVFDIDGNEYGTVIIGNQVWLTSDLKVKKFNDGTPIPFIGDNVIDWANAVGPAYTWPMADVSWSNYYGALYNFFVVESEKNICPDSWHVPTLNEWSELQEFAKPMGGDIGERKLISCRQENSSYSDECNTSEHPRWNSSNSDVLATNKYGLSIVPGGYRSELSQNQTPGRNAFLWANSLSKEKANVIYLRLYKDQDIAVGSTYKRWGCAIRCIKDNDVGIFIPKVETVDSALTKPYSITLFGNVNSSGGSNVFDRGFYYGTEPDPQFTGIKVQVGNGLGTYELKLTGVTPSTTIYVRAYAKNTRGESQGYQLALKSQAVIMQAFHPDTVSVDFGTPADSLVNYIADSIQIIDTDSLYHKVKVNWGSYGSYNSWEFGYNSISGSFNLPQGIGRNYTNPVPQTVKQVVFVSSISIVDTVRVMRLSNYNNIMQLLPDSTIIADTNLVHHNLKIDWSIANYDSTRVDTLSAIGLIQLPLNFARPDSVKELTLITQVVIYNDTLFDANSNSYKLVDISGQIWMAENLKTKVAESGYIYDDDDDNLTYYGRLYTWQDALEVCPDGYHLPGLDEWQILIDTVGGKELAGGVLKSVRTVPDQHPRWRSPNTGAVDTCGFSVLPGGMASVSFFSMGYIYLEQEAHFWSADEPSSRNATAIRFKYNNADIQIYNENKDDAYSVRCIKDSE
ncbi:MAG: FISUMP domain-containing protein [Salinivirgaceae bacterium]|jgi:uncharacterized protein (TIGR02145 family)|nr:FISUMP domain-containing protein [Salinivirgaceae bacterium]